MIVNGFGPLDAKIVIIGEAPGVEEERTGQPFVGASGHLLNQVLARIGINRNECYITNVVKTRPPNNDFGVLYEDKKKTIPSPLLLQSITNLHGELRNLRPSLIIPLGGEALRAVTNKIGIDKWRGSILPSPFGKVLSTYHPARVLREFTLLPIFTEDLKRAFIQSKFPEIRPLGHKFNINPSYSAVVSFLESLLDKPRPIAFDIETTKNHIRCLGIADSSTTAICIPFMSSGKVPINTKTIFFGPTSSPQVNSHWMEEEEYVILSLLDRVFSDRRISKYAQNFPFDSQILGREFGFTISGFRFDTLVAAHTMYAELPKGLDFLASLYTDVPYYSDYDSTSDEELWTYNCYDCCVTYQLSVSLHKDLLERVNTNCGLFNSLTFLENHIQPAMQVMTRVGQRGVLINLGVRDELKTKYTKELEDIEKRFQDLCGPLLVRTKTSTRTVAAINPGSPQQVQSLLYDKLGLPKMLSPKTKLPTTDEPALEKLRAKFPKSVPYVDLLLEWREVAKLISTYLDIPLTVDNRLTTSFNVVGTVTGRCNSSSTIWGEGTNLQNIPVKTERGKVLRKMFIPDPGYVLIKTDLSQAEFRLVVWFAKIRRLIEKYLTDSHYDCHRWVASLIYKKKEEEIIKKERDIAKNGVYGGNYHMMPKKAAQVYKLSLEMATFVLNAYRTAIPEVPQWWKEVEGVLNASRSTVNPFGRVRVWMDRLDDSTYRDAYSHVCQCTVADLIHRAGIVCELTNPLNTQLLQVHDEWVSQCRIEDINIVLPKIKASMEYPLQIDGVPEPLIIPADIKVGWNWLEMKEWDGKNFDISTLGERK